MPDLLKRFTPTPIENMFDLRGATVKLETNSQVLADRLLCSLRRRVSETSTVPDFVWRIVVEPDGEFEVRGMASDHRLSHQGLSFVTIGQKSFLASDLQTREGVAFISENIASNETLFRQYFLPELIALVKESLEGAVRMSREESNKSCG
jgi:hypothetical protein